MAETMVERMPLMEDMGVDNEDVEAGLQIRQRKKFIIGATVIENEENDEGHSVHFDQDKDVDGTKENKDPNDVSADESYNLSNKITENGSESQVITEKKKEPEIEEAEQVVDYDVERVIAEQETHDLFCPNCHSCITKRVILRKRKRLSRQKPTDFPPQKIPNVPFVAPEVHNTPPEVGNAPAEAKNAYQEKEVFRCLSCFSFFVPTEGGFNIFPGLWKSEVNSNLPSSDTASGKKVNCISFLFGSNSSDNKNSETDKDSIPTGPAAKPPVHEDGDDAKLPISVALPSADDSIGQPLLPKRHAENNPIVPTPETPAVADNTVLDIDMQEVSAPASREWDILKSIVYGGLIESITSLSVVSSAAGAGSSTLNICALGLANLVSGLFLISHDLSELKRGTNNEETTDQTQSQYYKKLGKKENFKRHAFFSVLSFIIFGLIPPIVYGFSFRQSDNKENKIIAVAASTLPCIAMLALGKAHVNPQKGYFRSLFYYIGLALPASGLAYVAGVMVDRLFEEYGLFHQCTHNIPSVSLVKPAWVDF